MIKKIGILGISLLCLATTISCEKDFNDLGGNVIHNTKFKTEELLLDLEVSPINIEAVRTDNFSGPLGKYWLGAYNNENYQAIQASIISQIGYISNLKNKATSGTDSIYNLDKVILKIPYSTTVTGKSNGITNFEFDSYLGNLTTPTSLKVFQNETFLKTYNPTEDKPAQKNTYLSNAEYLGDNLLNEDTNFTFSPDVKKDTVYSYSRIDRIDTSKTYLENVKVKASSESPAVPFLAIPLDLTKMKALFWDEFEGDNFASQEAFNKYFYGLKIIASGDKGVLMPFNLTSSASLVFQYSISISKDNKVIKSLNKEYSFPLSGIKNSHYKMTMAEKSASTNNFKIQGTAGSMAKIKIFDDAKLQELKAKNLLINDASLTFYVNQNIDTDKDIVPQRLLVYQNINKGAKGFSALQLIDADKEEITFGGHLEVSEDKKPEKYTFKITHYISDLLNGTTNNIDPLILKVYNNPTDNAIKNKVFDENIKTYNWNPRGVTLFDGNKTANNTKRAVLKISYSKEK